MHRHSIGVEQDVHSAGLANAGGFSKSDLFEHEYHSNSSWVASKRHCRAAGQRQHPLNAAHCDLPMLAVHPWQASDLHLRFCRRGRAAAAFPGSFSRPVFVLDAMASAHLAQVLAQELAAVHQRNWLGVPSTAPRRPTGHSKVIGEKAGLEFQSCRLKE